MYYENETLGQHTGVLCVVYETPMYSEPVLVRHYWPIAGNPINDWQKDIGEELDGHDGRYHFKNISKWPPYGLHRSVSFPLINGPRTEPIHTEHINWPCPKVRKGIPIRYLDGRWQKCLKTRGWVCL